MKHWDKFLIKSGRKLQKFSIFHPIVNSYNFRKPQLILEELFQIHPSSNRIILGNEFLFNIQWIANDDILHVYPEQFL